MRHLFIVNPAASKWDMTSFVAEKAWRTFSRRSEDYDMHITRAPRDAEATIKRFASEGGELLVYACGGDGTLNECISGAAGLKNVAVTHFPCGTGNDFVKTFGDDRKLFSDLSLLADGEAYPIDLIRCNDRYCVNICSIGFDARVGTGIHKYRRLPIVGGAAGYLISAAVEFIHGINQPMRVYCPGREFHGEIALVCACNGRYYGGGFNPVTSAVLDDGVLEFLVVPGCSRLNFLRLIGDYSGGRHLRHPKDIIHIRGGELTVDADEELTVNIDGEAFRARHVELSVIPGGVNFVFPKGISFFKSAAMKNEAIRRNS